MKVAESDDNPNKLCYCCMDSKNGCAYFKFWMPSSNDIDRGVIFAGLGTCQANYELLMSMQKDMMDLKSLMQKAQQNGVKCNYIKTMLFLSMFFLICVAVASTMSVVMAAK